MDSLVFYLKSEPIVVPVPALIRPSFADVQKYGVSRILRDNSPTEAVNLEFGTVLVGDETHINRRTYDTRIAGFKGLPGWQQLLWLIEHQDDGPLASFKAMLGEKIYLDFRGFLVTLGRSSGPRFPYLSEYGGHWVLGWDSTGGLMDVGRLAVAA